MSKGAPAIHELDRRLRQQALLAEIGRRALADTSLDSLFAESCRLCAVGLDVRYCKILEYQPSENRLLVRAGFGWREGVVGHATVGADLESPAGYALHTGKPVVANRLSQETRFRKPQLLAVHGVERALNVILDGHGHPFGVLEADSELPGAFSEHDTDFLQGVANLIGVALDRRRIEDELRALNEELEQRVVAEIAERHQAEEALRQAQKMQAIGQLTGGIAHDFNNLLMLISGSLELISREMAADDRMSHLIATAQRGATRGAQLTAQLLAFARRQDLRPETKCINDLVTEFDVLAGPLMGETVQIDLALDPAAGACHIDPAQFSSALINLAINARDAMPSSGTFTVRTGNVELDARTASRHAGAKEIAYVFVEIGDTGAGMAADVLARATEPFYTTKEVGKGTGLGLSQVYGFVSQSGGFLTIDSVPDVGTRVRIHLPRHEPQALAGDGDEAGTETPARQATVLVVEDDADVRCLVIDQLESLGYRTLSAANGPEALQRITEKAGAIDLVLTDVVMSGGMSGVDLVHALHIDQPSLPVILTSGLMTSQTAGEPGTLHETVDLGVPVLAKPYRQEDLARAIERAFVQHHHLTGQPIAAERRKPRRRRRGV
jgi:signal transduction histidine kinase/FixJ family two-component response regulator